MTVLQDAQAKAATLKAGNAKATAEETLAARDNVSVPEHQEQVSRRRAAGRRRGLHDTITHAPQRLRALVRADEIWLVVLAAGVGVFAGLMVTAVTSAARVMQSKLFALSRGEDLSTATDLKIPYLLVVPMAGGLAVGLSALLLQHWKRKRAVDPIEANALYGGNMSLRDSLWVVAQTLLSNGFGASVGLEAAYTQMGAAIASRLGRSFRVRRSDLRMLVGCGAAGAIAGAFNAPLAGAFYAYELVIGTYTIVSLAPVVVSAIVATAVVQWIGGGPPELEMLLPTRIEAIDYIPLIVLSLVCALIAIAFMKSVTVIERGFRASRIPAWSRPGVGGIVVGLLAILAPSVLSSGHSALGEIVRSAYPIQWVGALILLKAVANAVSLGSGFVGGMFFASIYLGGLVGNFFALLLPYVLNDHMIPVPVCAMVGMTSLAVAVVGGPLTLTFLALEETGSLPLTAATLVACVISSLTVRRLFGYSFTTWRFHLRGEAIRSAVDVGWIRTLSVGRMMRKDVRTVRADTTMAAFHHDFPVGATERIVAVDNAGDYAGIVLVAEVHSSDDTVHRISEVLHHTDAYLLPDMTVKEAIAMFEETESDALAVLESKDSHRVLGLLTEQHALRRYSEVLDQKRRELAGE
jgi:CIC family chloride channel protein